jgi:ABC-type multidrug transport system fused ATPase/permease subunit
MAPSPKGRRKLSISIGAGRRGSVVAGLETVPPASVVFHSLSVTVNCAVPNSETADAASGSGEGAGGEAAGQGGAEGDSATTVLLRDVSGIARAGELVAVMGPSGSGKTSLLTALAGGSRTAGRESVSISGSLEINGEKTPLGSLVSSRIASFVTQEECLLPGLTVRCDFHNIALLTSD